MGLSAATAALAATGAVSSFAWFATNTNVTANGMVIKATSNEVFLQIKNSAATWSNTDAQTTAAALVGSQAILSPTHPVKSYDASKANEIATDDSGLKSYAGDGSETTQPNWVSATASSYNSATKNNEKYVDVSTAANTLATKTTTEGSSTTYTTNGYTLLNEFNLRLRPAESSNQPSVDWLTASVSWATTPTLSSDPIAASVRVLLWNTTDNVGAIYTPATSSDSDSAVAWTDNKADLLEANKTSSSTDLTASWTAASTDNPVKNIYVYVYFDGEDSNCTSKNIKTDNTYSVTVSFSVGKKSS